MFKHSEIGQSFINIVSWILFMIAVCASFASKDPLYIFGIIFIAIMVLSVVVSFIEYLSDKGAL